MIRYFKCIDNDNGFGGKYALTIGKIYKVDVDELAYGYLWCGDENEKPYKKDRFVEITRNEKLNRIL
jgi:hypothetical protein